MYNDEQAEFNSGLALIYQLDAIEKELIKATVTSDYDMHYRVLVAYFKTLYSQLKKKEQQKQLQNWKAIKNNFKEIVKAKRNGKNSVPQRLIDEFDAWEMELRDLKQRAGLGMPKRDLTRAIGGS